MFPIGTSLQRYRVAWVTWAIIAVNIWVFVNQLLMPDALVGQWINANGVVPQRMWSALTQQPWAIDLWLTPIFTSMFIHGGFLHIIGNMLFIYTFGPGVEQRLGRVRYAAFYALCGVCAALAQSVSGPGSVVPMVGASGAVAGVLGAFLLLYPKAMVVLLVPILFIPFTFTVPALLFLLFWFIQQALFAWADLASPVENQGGIAWWAHIGGFVAGVIAVIRAKRAGTVDPAVPAAARPADAEVIVTGRDGRVKRYVVKRHPSRYGVPVPKRWQR